MAPPVELHTRDEGAGAPILLVHGVGGDHTIWNAVLPTLAREFRVLAPDLRGHGRSAAPPGSTFSLAEMRDDLLAVLASKGLRSVHWVGLSAGALIGLREALDATERIRSLTMLAGAGFTDARTRAIAARWAETLAEDGPDAYALRLLKDLYYPDWIEAHLEVADRLRAEVERRDLGPALKFAEAAATFDERPRVAALVPPLLLVQGIADGVVDAAHGRILRQSVPGAQLRLLPETGHMIPVERPAETAEAIATFVRSVESRETTSSA
ncbi:MAG TPA: alpha/beta fold hydrolase [Thermoplasmata archaeon]|nr:alpha/beta fold hydrolase [Thermoplasmata archaeon]